MANYNKPKKAISSWELHCKGNGRKLELGEVRRHREDSKKIREIGKRGKRENWGKLSTQVQDDSRPLPLFTA